MLLFAMDYLNNPQLQLAYDFVLYTNTHVFLTGKAGTGKTTFLRELQQHTPKRMVVAAPTGVAAINAGGVTIHSFFQLPFTPFVPEQIEKIYNSNSTTDKISQNFVHKLSRNKIRMIKSLDLLVIDEISMVRADLLDAVDNILRRYRRNEKPFGGVQLLMIGDLNQLAPVIKEDEWSLIKSYYHTAFFLGSRALQKAGFTTIELQKIYRQQDEVFIGLLGKIRENKLDQQAFELLNSRYINGFNPDENEGYIILTTHNAIAGSINEKKLAAIDAKEKVFKATIKGDFQEYMYPNDEHLCLKIGAQVMFIKNDSSFEKLYYNGKIGRITNFGDECIYVSCDNDDDEIEVRREVWDNVKYHLNESSREIEEEKIGSFTQFPLKTAWAITVHKSQGLTFEKAIIDVNQAFAPGQVYVALSRCRSLDGLVLISKIPAHAIKTDYTISEFNENMRQSPADTKKLLESRAAYQQQLIIELFDFENIKKLFSQVHKVYDRYASSFGDNFTEIFKHILHQSDTEIYKINEKFLRQLQLYLGQNYLPQDNTALLERISKASEYFGNKLEEIFINQIKPLYFDSDNKEIKKEMAEIVEKFELGLTCKMATLKAAIPQFDVTSHVRSIANSELDFIVQFNRKRYTIHSETIKTEHKELYADLNAWRKSEASASGVAVYKILPQKTLLSLVQELPVNLYEISKIKGFGKVKLKKYGDTIVEIIISFCERNNIPIDPNRRLQTVQKEKRKPNTKLISFEMYRNGLSISEIASTRNYAESTIMSHLSHYVNTGEIAIQELMPIERVNEIENFLTGKPTDRLQPLYELCGEKYSYAELRLIIEHTKHKNLIQSDISE